MRRAAWVIALGACAAPAVAPSPPLVTSRDAAPRPTLDAPIAPTSPCPIGAALVRAPYPERGEQCQRPEGVLDGVWRRLHPDGSVAIEAHYAAGVLEGEWRSLAPDGTPRARGAYVAGRRHGPWTWHHRDGQVAEADFQHGTGAWREPLDAGWLEANAVDGELDGARRGVDASGATWWLEQWRAGQLDGDRQVGTRAGLRVEERWQAGRRVGPRRIWVRGVLRWDEAFDADGRRHGAFVAWRSARDRREVGRYAHGERDGTWTWFARREVPSREGTYRAGKRHGTWTEWDGGRVAWKGRYRDGVPDGAFVSFDRRGRQVGRDVLVRGAGVVRSFHASGRVASESAYVGGRPEGAHREYAAGGQVLVEGQHLAGERTGRWTTRDARGALRLEVGYDQGRRDGPWRRHLAGAAVEEAAFAGGARQGPYVERFADGSPAVIGQYRDDRKDGEWRTFVAPGVLSTVATYRAGVLDGPWIRYDAGQVVEQRTYSNGW